ncbi:hypothetical protein CRE_19797 [Caenorhabditis remanei]|uniref:Serpentine Receptor, class H n=1 Tax=Caenorhabditis remanei TaxID=31234 RepID=E3MTC6_CAERE|nr:hypothetical protein CRE_19797 [Caenorhabditis remanei]
MTYCSASDQFSYFSSVEFNSLGYHSLGAIAIPFHILGAYCIIFKTPQTMRSVKWPMLSYHILTTLVDVMFGFMVCPYVIAPFSIMLPSGVLQVLGVYGGVQVYVGIMSVEIMAVSMVQIVENRYMILRSGNLRWQKIRIPWFCLNYSFASLATLPMYLEIPKDQGSAKSDIFVRKFHRAYIIQIGCPFTFMVIPFSMILFEYFSMSFNQTVNNIALLMIASYGLSSTIMMLLVHSPYRKFLKEQLSELFGIQKMARNQTVNVIIPSVGSMKSRINLV